jgi:poly(3-hydroxybutyrate) depolymerase
VPKTLGLLTVVAMACVAVSVPLASALGGTPPSNTVPPAISGSPVQGQTLSTSTGTWTGTLPILYTFQWLRCRPGGACSIIFGATKPTYVLTSAEVGDTIISVVGARNAYGRATAKSAPTATVTGSGGGGGGGLQTGASKATCSTSPCHSGAIPNGSGQNGCTAGTYATNIVALGKISNGSVSECRLYGYYKPANLSGLAATVLVAPGANGLCGGNDVGHVFKDSRWQSVADANRLVLILLAKPGSPSCRSGWYAPNIQIPQPGAGTPSDEPYVRAVLNDATSRLPVDSQRIYLTGASSGGNLVYDVACDPTNGTRFRGFTAVSAFMQAKLNGSSFVPGTERCGAPGGGSTTNNSFFIQNVHGTNDGSVPFGGRCLPRESHCIVSFAENARWWAQHMGCAARPTVTMFGSPSALNEKDDYSSCTFGSPAVSYESVKVKNGCHAWNGLDAHPAFPSTCPGNPSTNNTNSFYTAQTIWDWFSTRAWTG